MKLHSASCNHLLLFFLHSRLSVEKMRRNCSIPSATHEFPFPPTFLLLLSVSSLRSALAFFSIDLLLMQVGFEQLLERDTERRLGFMEETSPIREHPFFRDIDWVALEARKLEPPFKPKVVSTLQVYIATFHC